MATSEALLIRPALNIGVTGHRGLDWEADRWQAVDAGIGELLERILKAVRGASSRPFFTQVPVQIRVVSMLAEGADQRVSAAAAAKGMTLWAVLPSGSHAYRETMSRTEGRDGLRSLLNLASGMTVLGEEAVSDASFERANGFILAQADLLIAVWDGLPARGRGGTGEVVQKALDQGIPVFVVEAEPPGGVTCIQPPGEALLPGTAADLPRFCANGEVERAVRRIMLPPASSRQREAFLAMLAETERLRRRRFEHRLISWLGGTCRAAPRRAAPGADLWQVAGEQERSSQHDASIGSLRSAFERVDALADHYGTLTRSSEASQFLLLAFAACLSAGLAFLRPELLAFGSLLQIAMSGLILADSTVGRRRRWYERWIDYRALAERIRCMRFLHASGQAAIAEKGTEGDARRSWTSWFAARLARGLEPAEGLFSEPRVCAGYRQVQLEVAGQIAYHRTLIAAMTRLDRRLDGVSRISLGAIIAASALQLALAFPLLPAGPTLLATVTTLAALATAILSSARGLRSSVNTAGHVGRSQFTVIRLARLLRRMKEHPPSLDRLTTSAALAAALMIDDFGAWHTSLATRRPAKLRQPVLTRRGRR